MITYIACDNKCNIGTYFDSCAKDGKTLLKHYLNTEPTFIKDEQLNQANIDIRLEIKGGDASFIFLAYSHGVEDALKAGGLAYVKVDENTHLFRHGLIYTNACLTAQELGPDLIENGAFAFVGYNEEVDVMHGEDHQKILKYIDNFALTLFLYGYPIGEAVEGTKRYLSSIIELKEPYRHKANFIELTNVYKAELIEIRDAMEVIGNKDLTINDLVRD